MPDYDDEWVALFYNLWYQPKHINIAYRMINHLMTRRNPSAPRLTDSGNLAVVDFGCGSLAMQFGVALVAAGALQRGEPVAPIKYRGIDTSAPMIRMGQRIWDEFVALTNGRSDQSAELALVRDACHRIDTEIIEANTPDAAVQRLPLNAGEECWISAIHTVYGDNPADVHGWLNALRQHADPVAGFVTSYDGKKHLARRASPFGAAPYDQRYRLNITGGFDNVDLPKVTALRQNIVRQLRTAQYSLSDPESWSLVQNFLNRPANWHANDVAYYISIKR